MKKIILTFIATLLAGFNTAWAQNYVAETGGTQYETLTEALSHAADGETIKLLDNCSGGGLFIGPNKFTTGLTIDFNSFTYTVNTPVGSSSTVNQALHFEKGNKITLKNGAINMTDDDTELAAFQMFMQNYGTLIIDEMAIDGTGIAVATYAASYGAPWGGTTKPQFNYNTAGSSVIRNSTITMPGDLGIDDAAALTIEDDAIINVNKIVTKGTDERYSSANPTITVETGAKFTLPQAGVAALEILLQTQGKSLGTPVNGVYQVVDADATNAVAHNKQTGAYYGDLQLAIDLASAGQTIELLPGIENVTLDKTVTINKNLTIEGNDHQVTSEVKTGSLYGPRLDPAFHITGPGSVTLNKVNIVAPYVVPGHDGPGMYDQYTSGSVGIVVDHQFNDSLVINYSTITTTGRGIDILSIGGGFVLDVKHSTITTTDDDPATDYPAVVAGFDPTKVYINSFEGDPYGRGRGINFGNSATTCVANIQFSKIQGYAYPINVGEFNVNTGKVVLNMTDCSTWGRDVINNSGDQSTFNLDNITAHGYNNELSANNESFAAIVDYKNADLNFYNIKDLKVISNVKASDAAGTSASENFIDLRGTNATVKIVGNSAYEVADSLKDRVGFLNTNLTPADDLPEGDVLTNGEEVYEYVYRRLIDKSINNRIYFDDQAKAYFNYWFEIIPSFDYDYDNDNEDEEIRIAIDSEKDHTNLYPVVPLEVKVLMTITEESDDPSNPIPIVNEYYFGNLNDAFNSEHFDATAEIQLLANVDLDEDIIVKLDRGLDFSLTLINLDGNLCSVNVSNDASIKLPPLVYAYCDEAQGGTLFSSADTTLTVIKGVSGGVITYYVPANVYYADTYEAASGDPNILDPNDPNYYNENIDGGLLWIFKELLTTDDEAPLAITADSYVRLEADVKLDETYILPIGGDVDNEEVFYLDLNNHKIKGYYKSLAMQLGTAVYTTGTIDIFSSLDPAYTVVYDILDTPIETTYTDFEGNPKTVRFTHKYYLLKDGLAITVDPATFCGDRLTPNFVVKKKFTEVDPTNSTQTVEVWKVLTGVTKDDYDNNTTAAQTADFYWYLVPPASDDDDSTYVSAKTYVQALVIEGISFQGTRKADFTILPRDIKDVTVSGNEQPWREAGYTPAQIEDLIKLVYECSKHGTDTTLIKNEDYIITVANGPGSDGNTAQNAINYVYPATNAYTYDGTFTQVDAQTIEYYITRAAAANGVVNDLARFLGALYRASGVTAITYDGVNYTWSTDPNELMGSNWRDASNKTLVSTIISQFTPNLPNVPDHITFTTDKGDVTVNLYVTDDAPAASTGYYQDVDTYSKVITITAIEGRNYTGTLKIDFTILPDNLIDISKCMVVSNAVYTSDTLPPTYKRISVIYKKTDNGVEVVDTLDQNQFTIDVHGLSASYVNAKTYSNAITLRGVPENGYYGTLDADYVIKPRDIADSLAVDSENDNNGFVILEAYAGKGATETVPKTYPLQWTGSEIVPVINDTVVKTNNNINLVLKAKDDKGVDIVPWLLKPISVDLTTYDYSYTIEPSPMIDPGEYKIIFTGRGNFTGMREVKVMVLKDIHEVDSVGVPLQIIPDNILLKPSELQDVVVMDGDNLLVEGVHYTLTVKSSDGNTTYTDASPIKDDEMYQAIFTGKEPYYTNDTLVTFPVLFEYYSWDATKSGTDYYSDANSTSNYVINNDSLVSIHVTSGRNLECQIGDKAGLTAVKKDTTSINLPGFAHFSVGTGIDLTVVGIDDNAFNGCDTLHWIDATALKGYTPTTLSRSEDGPFNGYPVQSLVYLDGCSDVIGTNYIYKKGAGDFRCEELKIYDDQQGKQKGFTEGGGPKWEFWNQYEFTADKVTNTRYFLAGQHYTTCLPYKLKVNSDLKVYTLDAASDKIFGFKELSLDSLAHFTPFLLIPSKAGNLLNNEGRTVVYVTPTADQGILNPKTTPTNQATMYGSTIYMDKNTTAPTTTTAIYIMQSENKWKKIPADKEYDDACVLPMRAYIQVPVTSPAREYIMGKIIDSVEHPTVEVADDWSNAEVYDLQGRKVDTTARLPKGVYIVNGQKRIRK